MHGGLRMPRLLQHLIRSERGMAVPTVLIVIIVGLGLAGAAIMASIYAQRGSVRDQDTKAAIAAADAGAQLAILRQNKVLTTDALPCVIAGVSGTLAAGGAAGDGWCPAHTGTVGAATYSYRVRPATLVGTLLNRRQIRVVSVGTQDGVSRRIAVTATTHTGQAVFGEQSLVGIDELRIANNADVTGNVGSNVDVFLDNNARLCGDATHGIGEDFVRSQSATWCTGFAEGEQFLELPPPDQGSVCPACPGGPLNDNGRFFTQDRRSPANGNSVTWDSATRTLSIQGSGTLTVGGANYSVCRLVMAGSSSLIVARGSVVRFWFDTPENCGQSAGTTYSQISITGNSKVLTTSQNPTDLAFLLVGSERIATSATVTGIAAVNNDLTIYGPRTDLTVGGTSTYVGAMVGRTMTIGGSAIVSANPSVSAFNAPVLIQYKRERYVECTGGAMTNPPDSTC